MGILPGRDFVDVPGLDRAIKAALVHREVPVVREPGDVTNLAGGWAQHPLAIARSRLQDDVAALGEGQPCAVWRHRAG